MVTVINLYENNEEVRTLNPRPNVTMKRSITVGSDLGQLPIRFWRLPSCVLKSKFPLPLTLTSHSSYENGF